jgi:Flp pilus assembly protein TadB
VVLLVVLATTIPATLLVFVLLYALFRRLQALSNTAARFRDDVQPIAEALQARVTDAQDKMTALPEKVPTKGPGARLRS